jgi:hypothetical protein
MSMRPAITALISRRQCALARRCRVCVDRGARSRPVIVIARRLESREA